jgi:hypothetical protein
MGMGMGRSVSSMLTMPPCGRTSSTAADAQAVKKRFVGGDGGQRQGRRFGMRQAGRLVADDALVHQLVCALEPERVMSPA